MGENKSKPLSIPYQSDISGLTTEAVALAAAKLYGHKQIALLVSGDEEFAAIADSTDPRIFFGPALAPWVAEVYRRGDRTWEIQVYKQSAIPRDSNLSKEELDRTILKYLATS